MWIFVLDKTGSRRAPARLRALFISGPDIPMVIGIRFCFEARFESQLKLDASRYTGGLVRYADVISAKIELGKAKVRLARNLGEIDGQFHFLKPV